MKWWVIGLIASFIFCYWCVPFLFSAMVQHDYDALYHGLQDGKRNAGAFVQEERKDFMTYSERYARGLE